jgi:titin
VVVATPATIPTAPLNLKADGQASKVVLSWQAPASNGGSAILHYSVFRGTNQTNLTLVSNVTSTSLTYTDSTAETGKTYFYSVSAVNELGESIHSDLASAAAKQDDSLMLIIVGVVIAAAVIGVGAFVLMRKK